MGREERGAAEIGVSTGHLTEEGRGEEEGIEAGTFGEGAGEAEEGTRRAKREVPGFRPYSPSPGAARTPCHIVDPAVRGSIGGAIRKTQRIG